MKRKTPVVKKSLDPNYNHTFVYGGLTLEQLRGMCLELTVWDREAMLSNEFLGGVRLSSGKGEIILTVHLSFTFSFQHFNLYGFSPNCCHCCADEFHSLVNSSVKEVILAYETLEVYAHVQNAFIMESTLYFLKIQMQRNYFLKDFVL